MVRKAKKDAAELDEDFLGEAPAAEGETVQSKLRKKEAARKKEGQPEVKKTWYEFKRGTTYDAKKGLKLVQYQLTKNGAQSIPIGWEKKIPKAFLKKIRASGELKE